MIAGSERIIPIEQALEEVSTAPATTASETTDGSSTPGGHRRRRRGSGGFHQDLFLHHTHWEEDSEERRHADFLMEYIIKPAVAEFGLTVVRADQMGKPGMIGKQVIENILNARLVIADLSFHNPNVFYELCLRHATRLPTVQIRREVDTIPFDLNQYRTDLDRDEGPSCLKSKRTRLKLPIKQGEHCRMPSLATTRSLCTTRVRS